MLIVRPTECTGKSILGLLPTLIRHKGRISAAQLNHVLGFHGDAVRYGSFLGAFLCAFELTMRTTNKACQRACGGGGERGASLCFFLCCMQLAQAYDNRAFANFAASMSSTAASPPASASSFAPASASSSSSVSASSAATSSSASTAAAAAAGGAPSLTPTNSAPNSASNSPQSSPSLGPLSAGSRPAPTALTLPRATSVSIPTQPFTLSAASAPSARNSTARPPLPTATSIMSLQEEEAHAEGASESAKWVIERLDRWPALSSLVQFLLKYRAAIGGASAGLSLFLLPEGDRTSLRSGAHLWA
jgi:hypothetical protein